ncbi:hypothetical protein NIES970_02650 [[Synechococcus] sp. NIES-970]|nr:hypothetical protein NIES970_02650 [[Synechococcus] sp. NIES-970]
MIKNKLSETVSVNTEIGNEFEKRINFLKRISRIKECFCKNKNCSSQIINAHSIQNNKILREIAVNGKVISIVPTEVDNQFATKTKKIGRKVATVSTNFCGYHDTEFFLPIESKDYQKNNRQQEFLFAYRALAKEYHAKREMLLFLRNSIYQSSS